MDAEGEAYGTTRDKRDIVPGLFGGVKGRLSCSLAIRGLVWPWAGALELTGVVLLPFYFISLYLAPADL